MADNSGQTTVHRSWCYTINNPNATDIAIVSEWTEMATTHYCAREVAPSGTPHLQGYIVFKTGKRLSAVKKLHPTAHWEAARGTAEHNRKYILEEKPDGHGELGEPIVDHNIKKQGERNDLHEAAEMVRGEGLTAVANKKPTTFIKYHAGLKAYQTQMYTKRDWKRPPRVYWLAGPTGTGKTEWAYRMFEHLGDIYECQQRSTTSHTFWWAGYEQQPVVIIDDARPGTCSLMDLLKITDRYPYRVCVATGTFMELNSPIIVVTSALKPQEYATEGEKLNQLYRRITQVIVTEKNKKYEAFDIDEDGEMVLASEDDQDELQPSEE